MTTTEAAPNPRADSDHSRHAQQLEVLTETCDYTRRIHWWIRLVGVTWLTTIALSLLAGAVFVIALSDAANDNGTPARGPEKSDYSSRTECIDAFETTLAQCNDWFGTD